MVRFLVYLATCSTRKGNLRFYVGIAGMRKGPSTRAALMARRASHVSDPVAWFRRCDLDSLRLQTMATGLSRPEALSREASTTASLMAEQGRARVRGGPWCRCALSDGDRREITKVQGGECLKSVAQQNMKGSLWHHLHDLPYDTTTSSGEVVLPVAQAPRKRASGVSGHRYRVMKALKYGTAVYFKNKYGYDPAAARGKHQRTFRRNRRQ